MAAAGRPPGHSGNLSDKTCFQHDEDELMGKIWRLKQNKEEIEEKITKTRMEIDGWLQVLSCSTTTELEQLMDEVKADPSILPGITIIDDPSDLQRLAKYCKLATELSGFELLDCSKAYTTEKGDLFIKFPWRPPCMPGFECMVLLKPEVEHTYSLVNHNLPPTVPLESLVKKYLENPRHGPDGVRKFVAVVAQYTKAMYSRLQQVMALEGLKVLNDTAVNYNKGATSLAFTLDPRLKKYPSLLVEFVLKFSPLDILPETVVATALCLGTDERVPPRLQEMLDATAQRMKTATFPEVLMDMDRQGRAAQPSTSTFTSSASTSLDQPQQREEPSTTAATERDSDLEEETLAPLFDIGE